ncbi:MAG: hypothetical protein QOJ54_3046, partial [Aliidongia sp.]|nr:hypothetical protein [Aliidongia sp.]
MSASIDLPNAVTLATPIFVVLVVLEAILTRRGRIKGSYETRDT